MPYFLLALKKLGESGMSRGYKLGYEKFQIDRVESLGYNRRSTIHSGDTVFNRAIRLSYQEMLRRSTEHRGSLILRLLTPIQIKENDRFTPLPTFRGLISRLLLRANAMAEFYGSGMLYDNDRTLDLLGECRSISITEARIQDVRRRDTSTGRRQRCISFHRSSEAR